MNANEQHGCGCGSGSDHPIDALLQEHATILAVLDAAEHEVLRIEGGGEVHESFWRQYLEFLANYADRCHHAKEEDVLFRELERRGLSHESGPTACMRHEHDEMRMGRNRLAEILTSDDTSALCSAVRGGIAALRAHIDKENDVLFPMARDLLDPQATERVRRGFDETEHGVVGAGVHQRYEQLAHTLCDRVRAAVD